MNYLFRDGYSEPFFRSRVATGDVLSANKSVLVVGGADWFKLPSVHSFDIRIGKQQKIDKVTANLDIDIFNALNLATALGKQYDLRLATAGQVLEIMNPRIIRIGVRIGF